jgi:single-stranded-DNA-specific exonuclease|tara:strand:+ start:9332 stop:11050 length:1719 start_codon:yes stop_codon:yes gene_type:complete
VKRSLVRRSQRPAGFSDDVPALLQRIYTARGIENDQDLDLNVGRLLAPDSLKGIEESSRILCDALTGAGSILIVGDFDADGATSAALMVLALKSMGAESVDYLVPNRFEFGYGLTPEIVEVAAERHPDLIITVDNGISSIEGVALARQKGIKVLITDHHLSGEKLPAADAIVNPNQPGCQFPSKYLAGVGVAFYVLSALRSRLRSMHWFEQKNIDEPRMADFLDLVALGTVADVVTLDYNNRIVVNEGLRRIRAGRSRTGIMALLEITRRDSEHLVAADLAFAVGPRLNAAGRLKDMSLGIECLLSEDLAQARDLARRLNELNDDRRAIEAEMREQASAYLEDFSKQQQELPFGLCLYDKDWHQGVVGILASRIKERVNRPVIVFADGSGGKDEELKGSGRSVPGLHIRDALQNIASSNAGLITKFGGHSMAAGLTLDRSKFDEFKEAFDGEVRLKLSEDDLQGTILSDGELSPGEFSLSTAQLLRKGGPWGEGFAEPLFDGIFNIVQQRIVGQKHLKLRLRLDSGRVLEAIAFNHDRLSDSNRVRLAYRMDVNLYRGKQSLQLVIEELLDC